MTKGIQTIFNYFALFVSGLASGVAIGLLTAPKSGKELREDLTNKSEELKKISKDKLEELEDVGKSHVGRIANAIRNTADRIGTRLDEFAGNNGNSKKHWNKEKVMR